MSIFRLSLNRISLNIRVVVVCSRNVSVRFYLALIYVENDSHNRHAILVYTAS